jgi:hypothetical protein
LEIYLRKLQYPGKFEAKIGNILRLLSGAQMDARFGQTTKPKNFMQMYLLADHNIGDTVPLKQNVKTLVLS